MGGVSLAILKLFLLFLNIQTISAHLVTPLQALHFGHSGPPVTRHASRLQLLTFSKILIVRHCLWQTPTGRGSDSVWLGWRQYVLTLHFAAPMLASSLRRYAASKVCSQPLWNSESTYYLYRLYVVSAQCENLTDMRTVVQLYYSIPESRLPSIDDSTQPVGISSALQMSGSTSSNIYSSAEKSPQPGTLECYKRADNVTPVYNVTKQVAGLPDYYRSHQSSNHSTSIWLNIRIQWPGAKESTSMRMTLDASSADLSVSASGFLLTDLCLHDSKRVVYRLHATDINQIYHDNITLHLSCVEESSSKLDLRHW